MTMPAQRPETPLTVAFRGLPAGEGLRTACRLELDALVRLGAHVASCDVGIVRPRWEVYGGEAYEVQIVLVVAGQTVLVRRLPTRAAVPEEPFDAVREAFETARSRVRGLAWRREQERRHGVRPALKGSSRWRPSSAASIWYG